MVSRKTTLEIVRVLRDAEEPLEIEVEFARIDRTITLLASEVKYFANAAKLQSVIELRLGDDVIVVDSKNKPHRTLVTALELTDDQNISLYLIDESDNSWEFELNPSETIGVLSDD